MSERKEVVQLSGLTILVVIVIIADFLVVGFFYRWHSWQLFVESKRHTAEYKELLSQQHDLHIQITTLEGVAVWNDTQYMKHLGSGQFGQ